MAGPREYCVRWISWRKTNATRPHFLCGTQTPKWALREGNQIDGRLGRGDSKGCWHEWEFQWQGWRGGTHRQEHTHLQVAGPASIPGPCHSHTTQLHTTQSQVQPPHKTWTKKMEKQNQGWFQHKDALRRDQFVTAPLSQYHPAAGSGHIPQQRASRGALHSAQAMLASFLSVCLWYPGVAGVQLCTCRLARVFTAESGLRRLKSTTFWSGTPSMWRNAVCISCFQSVSVYSDISLS